MRDNESPSVSVGVGSALIYALCARTYAHTDELVALTQAAGEFGGGYTSHLRSEADRLLESIDELIQIVRAYGEIHHLERRRGSATDQRCMRRLQKLEAAHTYNGVAS